MREISEHALLTPKEEIQLAKAAFGKKTKAAEAAREELVTRNLRLVVTIAKGYQGNGLELMDLISEGNIGLAKSVERFDPRKGAKLSTYAAWWIKQSIRRAISNQSRTIRVPVHIGDKTRKLAKLSQQLGQDLKRDPTEEELAEEMGIPVERVRKMLSHNPKFTPLDAPLGTDDPNGATFGDSIADANAADPSQEVEDQSQKELLEIALKTLSPRERTIIEHRFGINGAGNAKTLETVGAKFRVTRERIRQIQNIALKKLHKRMEKFAKSGKTQFAS